MDYDVTGPATGKWWDSFVVFFSIPDWQQELSMFMMDGLEWHMDGWKWPSDVHSKKKKKEFIQTFMNLENME